MSQERIYLVGYSKEGARTGTALDQGDHWSYHHVGKYGESTGEFSKLPNMRAAISRLQGDGATLVLATPFDNAAKFIDDVVDALYGRQETRKA